MEEELSVGRPTEIFICKEEVDALVLLRYKWKDIAAHLDCSERTLRRWRIQLDYSSPLCDLENQQLDEKVYNVLNGHERVGVGLLHAQFHSEGIKVSRERIRESARRVDPDGRELRLELFMKKYSRRIWHNCGVHGSWHIDANLKCKWWGQIVLSSAVDGDTSLIAFLKVLTNMERVGPFRFFLEACDEYGVCPGLTRTDEGKENGAIGRFMKRFRGEHAHREGSSIYNCTVERLWKQDSVNVMWFYKRIFKKLEKDGLDSNNPWHIFCLHYMFLARIQEDLDRFRHAHNNSLIRTKGRKTPLQLVYEGRHEFPPPIDIDADTFRDFLEDEFGTTTVEKMQRGVAMRPRCCPLSDEQYVEFAAAFPRLTMHDLRDTLVPKFNEALGFLERFL